MLGFVSKSWRPVVSGTLLGLAVAGAVMLSPRLESEASAKAMYESPYGYDRTWNAALRLVRVDMGFKVTEKDEQSGYVMFDYRSPEGGGKMTPGSLELVRGGAKDNDGPVRVVVQLPQMPQYHEQVMVDALATKMRVEYGDPPAKKKATPPPQAPPPDAGADATP